MAGHRTRPAGPDRAGRHRTRERFGTRPAFLVAGGVVGGVVVLAVAAAVTVVGLRDGSAAAGRPAARPPATHPAPGGTTPAPASASASAAPASEAPASTAPPSTVPSSTAAPTPAALTRLVDAGSATSTSVAALDTVTGVRVTAGAAKGMTTASAAKVELLESLLLKHQQAGSDLTAGELTSVTAMIEHSDNDAADDVFSDIGGRAAVLGFQHDLGLSPTQTVLGGGDLWGLTTTNATQQLILLHNLVDPHGPLDAPSRALALRLMRSVEADQTWGAPVAATSGRPAVKNGWLAVGTDGGLWAVNSLGVVTVDGHQVLIAVLTQHNESYQGGVQRVETLVRAAAAAVHP